MARDIEVEFIPDAAGGYISYNYKKWVPVQDLDEALERVKNLRLHSQDACNDDTAIRDALRPIMGDMVDGDAQGVPPLVDLVHWLVAKLASLEHDLHLAEQGGANAH